MRKPSRSCRAAGLAVLLLATVACSDDDAAGPRSAVTDGAERSTTTSTTTVAPTFASSVEEVTADQLPASWRPGCPHPVESLRLVRLSHWGFDDEVHEGRIVVDAALVDDVVGIFGDLYAARYPIERMEPIDAYGGSDEASGDANNTSAFNCRRATGGTSWSEHAYGRAIDLNPVQNPYLRGDVLLPKLSTRYVDRTNTDPGVLHDGDPAVLAFTSRGWVWGGIWSSLKDYQHFSPSGR